MLRGLFVNSKKSQCSIHESGKMIFSALSKSYEYTLDYSEICAEESELPTGYNFFVFNYHPFTMSWLDVSKIKKLPGLKIAFVLEVLPNTPYALCPKGIFDIYCAIDPTMKINDPKVSLFPRPLEPYEIPLNRVDPEVVTVGSFGFATPGKGFERVVDAVSREFDEAIVKINIPIGDFVPEVYPELGHKNYSEYLGELCQNTASEGVEVRITHDYLSKSQLINWCSQNTLNCFLYDRSQPGLSATTDQAISCGRPLAISTNETFRHIHQYLKPYPIRSLTESIASSVPGVLLMKKAWTRENFMLKFEDVLFCHHPVSPTGWVDLRKSSLGGLADFYSRGLLRVSQILTHSHTPHLASSLVVLTVLIVSHKEKQCGIHEYGLNMYEALRKSRRYNFIYCECSSKVELLYNLAKYSPSAIIYNYYPATQPWVTRKLTRGLLDLVQFGVMHEVTQEAADNADNLLFDYHLCPDPTLSENNVFSIRIPRVVPRYTNNTPVPLAPTIGSFGFGFGDKGFDLLVEKVQDEFDVAHIRLHIPSNDVLGDSDLTRRQDTLDRCSSKIYKSGVTLSVSSQFLSREALLDFLAGNTLNAFFYNVEKYKGISSTIDNALAVQRPIAITKCGMFRHITGASPSICIEDSTLKEIISNGPKPLNPFYEEWTESKFLRRMEKILDRIVPR